MKQSWVLMRAMTQAAVAGLLVVWMLARQGSMESPELPAKDASAWEHVWDFPASPMIDASQPLRWAHSDHKEEFGKLSPDFAARLGMLIERLEKDSFIFVVLEGYRSPERQAILYEEGPHRTRAQPMQSLHQHGLAADLAPVLDGRTRFDTSTPAVWSLGDGRLRPC